MQRVSGVWQRERGSDDAMRVHTFEYGYNDPPEGITPDSVLDLGANAGYASVLYRRLWPKVRILAVEMDVENAALARRNVEGDVLCAAVTWEDEGPIRYSRRDLLPASYEIDGDGDSFAMSVPFTKTLDLAGPGSLFVKMDIEGAEWPILRRASEWADRVDALLVELHEGPAKLAQSHLEDAGYKVTQHPKHDKALVAVR